MIRDQWPSLGSDRIPSELTPPQVKAELEGLPAQSPALPLNHSQRKSLSVTCMNKTQVHRSRSGTSLAVKRACLKPSANS
jgi:hypothetical protein